MRLRRRLAGRIRGLAVSLDGMSAAQQRLFDRTRLLEDRVARLEEGTTPEALAPEISKIIGRQTAITLKTDPTPLNEAVMRAAQTPREDPKTSGGGTGKPATRRTATRRNSPPEKP